MTDQNDIYDIPQEFVDGVKDAMTGGRIELPFPAPFLWWANGDNRNKPIGDVPYFGGWEADTADADSRAIEAGLDIPTAWQARDLVNRQGTDFRAYCTRAVTVALIAKRNRWIIDESKPNSKGFGHIHLLCYMAEFSKEKHAYVPWGPVVLSAKGNSARFVEAAFNNFAKKTAAARAKFAKNLPPWFFYAAVGTFGPTPVVEMVGKVDKSPVNPCQVYLPTNKETKEPIEITKDHLDSWFVGRDVCAVMIDLKDRAKEWLEAWKTDGKGADKRGDVPPEPEFPPDLPEDEPPF